MRARPVGSSLSSCLAIDSISAAPQPSGSTRVFACASSRGRSAESRISKSTFSFSPSTRNLDQFGYSSSARTSWSIAHAVWKPIPRAVSVPPKGSPPGLTHSNILTDPSGHASPSCPAVAIRMYLQSAVPSAAASLDHESARGHPDPGGKSGLSFKGGRSACLSIRLDQGAIGAESSYGGHSMIEYVARPCTQPQGAYDSRCAADATRPPILGRGMNPWPAVSGGWPEARRVPCVAER